MKCLTATPNEVRIDTQHERMPKILLPPWKWRRKGRARNRRDFLNEIALARWALPPWGASGVTGRYLSPNVLFEPPTRFRAGAPDSYPVNSVTFIPGPVVYIVRSQQGIWALSAICTHLGCITQWKPEADMIACPCHGSKFTKDGHQDRGAGARGRCRTCR